MRGMSSIVFAAAVAAALVAPAPASAQIPQPFLALVNANVVDVRTGTIRPGATVLVRDGAIVSVGEGAAPSGARVLDLKGKYLLPGFMDAHTHLDNLAAAKRALESGATTVRSASVPSFNDVTIRELSKKGYIAGPDMLAAGLYVTPHMEDSVLADPELVNLIDGVTTLEQLRQLVRVNLKHGVDVIKTRGTERAGRPDTDPREQVYTEEQLSAVVEEALGKGVPVLAHSHGDEGSLAAVRAGVRSIEHGTFMSETTLQAMKERGTFFVPTYSTVVDLIEPGGDYDDPVVHVRGKFMLPYLQRTVRKAHQLGVPIVTGADSSYGPQSVTRVSHEIVNLAFDCGLTPLEALQAATVNAARLFGLEKKTGAIEVGLEADLVAVEENPLINVRTVQDVLLVISNGRLALDRLTFGKTTASVR
ncbi:MAG: amidohydrolase family protein [Vicinamibacterales bacterium]